MDQDKYVAWQNEMMEKHGWYVDCVFDSEDCKCESGTGADVHTHGLPESFGHPDLQCVLPINGKLIHSVFITIVNKIKEGKKFESGKCYSGLIKGFKLRFVESVECSRKVLRVILPDKNGKLHKNLMEEDFRVQYNGLG